MTYDLDLFVSQKSFHLFILDLLNGDNKFYCMTSQPLSDKVIKIFYFYIASMT